MNLKEIYEKTTRHFLAPVVDLLDDPEVSEVLVNGYDCVYFEKSGKLTRSDARFRSESDLLAAARNIADYSGRPIGTDRHSVDARLPDGSRVHVIVPPSSRVGVCISIRKFKKSGFDLESLVQWGSMTAEVREFLGLVVALHKNLVIAGGTGTGKTSMLNALSGDISADERIVVIEDTNELTLRQPHTVYLEAQPARPDGHGEVTIRDLFVDSLRMRPDRIIVGEVRRGEALDLVQSMISGHAGSLATVHASSPFDALVRLETLCLMSDVSLPIYVARAQVASAIHYVLQISRFADGSRRVRSVSECRGLDASGGYSVSDIYRFAADGYDEEGRLRGSLRRTGAKPSIGPEAVEMGMGDRIKLTRNLLLETSTDENGVASTTGSNEDS